MSNDHTASGLTGSDLLEAAAAEASAREFYDAEGLDSPPLQRRWLRGLFS
jgi:hypothetical protein